MLKLAIIAMSAIQAIKINTKFTDDLKAMLDSPDESLAECNPCPNSNAAPNPHAVGYKGNHGKPVYEFNSFNAF